MKRASQSGQQLAEFGTAFAFLIMCVVIPAVDLGIIPIRYGLAISAVNTFARKLSMVESASQAFQMASGTDSELSKIITPIGGIHVKSSNIVINIGGPKGTTEVKEAKRIQKDWLPDGQNCPCQYTLQLRVEVDVDPLITIPAGKKNSIPGLTGPFPLTLTGSSSWENLGRNPVTEEFFINE